MKIFKTDGLKELEIRASIETKKLEKDKNNLEYSVACFRRLHRLSKFNIISLEYLKEAGFTDLESEFSQIKYPFLGLDANVKKSDMVKSNNNIIFHV